MSFFTRPSSLTFGLQTKIEEVDAQSAQLDAELKAEAENDGPMRQEMTELQALIRKNKTKVSEFAVRLPSYPVPIPSSYKYFAS